MDYALSAEVMCVRRPEPEPWTAPAGLTFRGWLRGGGERPPTVEDLSYHLSTLFPPVRPRGHLEYRVIDAQPDDGWIVPAAVVTALLDDETASQQAMAAAETLWHQAATACGGDFGDEAGAGGGTGWDCGSPWEWAARHGPTDPLIGDVSVTCFEAAEAALGRLAAPAGRQGRGDQLRRALRRPVPVPRRRPARRGAPGGQLIRHRPDQPLGGNSAMTPTSTEALRDLVASSLVTARERTQLLTGCVDDADLTRQHSPLMSPLVWDLAHVANQEELWLLRTVGGREPMHPEIDPLYDAFEHPRAERPTLPLLPPGEARAYAHEVRGRVLDLVERATFGGTRLLTGAFAFGMIAQHEQQHDETMLITHQLRKGAPVLSASPPPPPPADALSLPREVLVPGGPFTMGTSTHPWALDNERPRTPSPCPRFYLDTTPVTNAAYTEFIADGGYGNPRWWSSGGLGPPAARGAGGPAVLAARRRRLGAGQVRRHRAGAAGRAGAARVLVRGGGLRRVGGPPPADRGGVGEGGETRPGHRPLAQLPVGRGGTRSGAGEPGAAPPPASARRQLPARRGTVRGQAADR